MKQVVKDYSGRAGKYGESIKTYRDAKLNDLMMQGLGSLPEGDLVALDLACGQGDASKHLREANIQVHYFDISLDMIEKGIERGIIPEEFSYVGDMDNLGLDDYFFDIIMSRYAFHDIQDQRKLLNQIGRILKKGGKAQITDMCSPSPEDPMVKEFYNFYHKWKTGGDPRECWIPDVNEMYQIFDSTGFRDLNELWYTSKVSTNHWLRENQITEERYKFLNEFILTHAEEHPNIKHIFNIREERGEVKIDFPVIILTGQTHGNVL
jgi:ubiquinone/menaquinone biosynthesis C-methylase UbiE